MVSDADLLESCPDFLSIGSMMKAHPSVDGGRRFVFFEASKQDVDQQDETVLSKALAESTDFYRRYGNVDLEHYTQIGAKLGIPNHAMYEIGRPIEVGQRDKSTFVKAEIFSGDGPAAVHANDVWSSLTDINPPQRWYPSVGGAVLAKAVATDPETNLRRTYITKVRWTNVGLSKTPVNQHVGTCATMPIGTFAKCMLPGGLDIAKALEAGYGTDAASLSGAGALRVQSLDTGVKTYWDFREKLAGAMRSGAASKNPNAAALAAYATKELGLSADESAAYVERFMRDLKTGLKRRNA